MQIVQPLLLEARTSLRLPLYSSKVEAGFPSPADDHIEDRIDLNDELNCNKIATFCIRVQGESMRDAGIHSGDILVINRSLEPSDRQIVVATINGEFTVKRYRKMDGRALLVAENPAFKAIEITEDQEFMVWGVVTYIIHKAR